MLGARDGEEVAGSVDVPSKRNKGSKGNAIKSKILLTWLIRHLLTNLFLGLEKGQKG